jgi:CheY-like chemotaxis protein
VNAFPAPHRILVAEDNRVMGNVLCFALQRAGYDVTLARSGSEAIHVSRSERFDFVLTDHQMPGASGLDLCRALRASPEHADVPILFCSAKGFELDVEGMRRELGVLDVVFKPFSTAEILDTVRNALSATIPV